MTTHCSTVNRSAIFVYLSRAFAHARAQNATLLLTARAKLGGASFNEDGLFIKLFAVEDSIADITAGHIKCRAADLVGKAHQITIWD